jgi:thioredoxin-related protein
MPHFMFSLLFSLLSFATDSGSAPCDDSGKVYKVCDNQEDSFNSALEQAKKEKKKLVAVIGAEWCPWCMSLHKMLRDPAVINAKLARKYRFVDVALYSGKTKLPTGLAVQEKLIQLAKFKGKIDGIPVLAVVNPQNNKAEIINTEPLEKNTETSKGHDPVKVLATLEKASKKVR